LAETGAPRQVGSLGADLRPASLPERKSPRKRAFVMTVTGELTGFVRVERAEPRRRYASACGVT